MATSTGTGCSSGKDGARAGAEAARMAVDAMGGARADLAVVFASVDYDHEALLSAVKKESGAAAVIGATTAGEFTEQGPLTASVAVMTVRSDAMRFFVDKAPNAKNNYPAAVDRALEGFPARAEAMAREGFANSTVVIMMDGLMGSGEELIDLVRKKAGILSQLVGGAAGDDGRFKSTKVFCGEEALSDAVAFLQIFSKKRVGIGVRHGMQSCTPPAKVTKARGGLVYEIGGKPAFDLYKAFAKARGVSLAAENAAKFMIAHELAIQAGPFTKMRAPLGANPDGSLNMASEIPEGAYVCVVDAREEDLTRAALEAAQEARRNMEGTRTAGVLIFDCICRKAILGDHFAVEIEAFREAFGGKTPIIGFATYGEIARFGGHLNGFHNSTAVVCALPD